MIASTRRFSSIERLLGGEALARLHSAHVLVIGIGGVGSWAAEALARSGVGALTLMDMDHVAESNINRQVHALETSLGAAKVEVMRERIAQINPACRVSVVDAFLDAQNIDSVLSKKFDAVLDVIDQVRIKALLCAKARELGTPVVVCGAAGGKDDPTAIRVADLSLTHNDPMLAKLRTRLRKDHAFPAAAVQGGKAKPMKVACVYSTQAMRHDTPVVDAGAGLACAGYGSTVTVTATMGFVAAAEVMKRIKERN